MRSVDFLATHPVFTHTTADSGNPELAIRSEVEYWAAQSIEDRVSAVETIREATVGIYTDEAAPRLERAYWSLAVKADG